MRPNDIENIFTPSTPILMVQNDCVIVAGDSMLNAYDRLEVAEYSAKAIIASKELGEIVSINDSQIEDIKQAFHLQ